MNKAVYFVTDELKLPDSGGPLTYTMVLGAIPHLSNMLSLYPLGADDDDIALFDRLSSVPDRAVSQLAVAGILLAHAGLNASYFLQEVEEERKQQGQQSKKVRNEFFLKTIREANQACAQRTVDYVHSTLCFFPAGVNKTILEYARWHQPQLPPPSKKGP